MNLLTNFFSIVTVSSFTIFTTTTTKGFSLPTTCAICIGEACEFDPPGCIFGVVRNACGQKVCAKGPDEFCGGPDNILGECGDGLLCKCHRCIGCSLRQIGACHNAAEESTCLSDNEWIRTRGGFQPDICYSFCTNQ